MTTSSKTAQLWTPPRTPWGDPDLQGNHTNIDELNVPIERPAQFDGRRREDLTDADLAEFTNESNATRRRTYEEGFGRNAFSNAFNRYDLKPSRAWLVMDPPDGRDMPNAFPPGASKDLRIIERFTPIAPNTLEWSVTFMIHRLGRVPGRRPWGGRRLTTRYSSMRVTKAIWF